MAGAAARLPTDQAGGSGSRGRTPARVPVKPANRTRNDRAAFAEPERTSARLAIARPAPAAVRGGACGTRLCGRYPAGGPSRKAERAGVHRFGQVMGQTWVFRLTRASRNSEDFPRRLDGMRGNTRRRRSRHTVDSAPNGMQSRTNRTRRSPGPIRHGSTTLRWNEPAMARLTGTGSATVAGVLAQSRLRGIYHRKT